MRSLQAFIATFMVTILPSLALGTTPSARADDVTPDALSRLLSGGASDAHMLGPTKAEILARYTKGSGPLWARWEKTSGAALATWATTEVPATPGETIFYPFAGPDFPTVQHLYPSASRYVLVAMQKAGPVPDLAQMTPTRLAAFLTVFGRDWRHFTVRGFFGTDELTYDTGNGSALTGLTPVLMAFASQLGYVVRSVDAVRVSAATGELEPFTPAAVPADWNSVRITLQAPDGRPVLLDYLDLDLSDKYLAAHDPERVFIQSIAGHRVVLKAAAHLLQKPAFATLRDAIVGHAPSVVQDESGVDYAALAGPFDVALYGHFVRASRLFVARDQLSLAAAYHARTDVKPLPFKIGYRKYAGSCLQVAIRRP